MARLEEAWRDFGQAYDAAKQMTWTEVQIEAISECYGDGKQMYLAAKVQLRTLAAELPLLMRLNESLASLGGLAQLAVQL